MNITTIHGELTSQFDKAVAEFRASPHAANYVALTSAMLGLQQLAQVFRPGRDYTESRQRIIAMCESTPHKHHWAGIVVEVATGKHMQALLREPTI